MRRTSKPHLEGYITGELNRLDGVEVVDHVSVAEADYKIHFMGFPIEYEEWSIRYRIFCHVFVNYSLFGETKALDD